MKSIVNVFPTTGQLIGPGGKFFGLRFLMTSARSRNTTVNISTTWTSVHFNKEELNTEDDGAILTDDLEGVCQSLTALHAFESVSLCNL